MTQKPSGKKIVNIEELHSKIMDAKKRGFSINQMLKEINVPIGSFYRAADEAGLRRWREKNPSSMTSSDEIQMPENLPIWWGGEVRRVSDKKLSDIGKKSAKRKFKYVNPNDVDIIRKKASEKASKKVGFKPSRL